MKEGHAGSWASVRFWKRKVRKVGRELEEGVPAESQRSGLPREDAWVSGMEACKDVRLDEEGNCTTFKHWIWQVRSPKVALKSSFCSMGGRGGQRVFDGGKSEKGECGRWCVRTPCPRWLAVREREEKQLNGEGFKHKRHLNTGMCLGEGGSEQGKITYTAVRVRR